MTVRMIPARRAIGVLAAVSAGLLVALVAQVPVAFVSRVAIAASAVLIAAAVWDYVASRRAWHRSSATMTRRLPSAFAIGVKRPVHLAIGTNGADAWRCLLHDHADPTLVADGMPVAVALAGG